MKKIVLTGGPGSGKTTISEVLEKVFSNEVVRVPEAASVLFKGGFPRIEHPAAVRAAQRAIFFTQIEMENLLEAVYPTCDLIADRGTLDGASYWPGGLDDFLRQFSSNQQEQYNRYTCVIYLKSPEADIYEKEKRKNAFRIENYSEAQALDKRNFDNWRHHPRFYVVNNHDRFSNKILEIIKIISEVLA